MLKKETKTNISYSRHHFFVYPFPNVFIFFYVSVCFFSLSAICEKEIFFRAKGRFLKIYIKLVSFFFWFKQLEKISIRKYKASWVVNMLFSFLFIFFVCHGKHLLESTSEVSNKESSFIFWKNKIENGHLFNLLLSALSLVVCL